MIFKNIEMHNIAEIEYIPDRNAYEMHRLPKRVIETLECGEQSQRIASNYTGVEFRFVIKGDKAVLRFKKKDNKIKERIKNTLNEIAGRNPGKPIYIISPFYCNDDFYGEKTGR